MNDTEAQPNRGSDSREAEFSALFAHLVIQQSNTAMFLMGKMPHPETGKTVRDLEAARLFIDQLEMLEAKTKGNLTKEESGLLKQTLMTLRLGYVEAVEEQAPTSPASAKPAEEPQPAPPPSAGAAADAEAEGRVKFSKKY